MSLFQWMFLSHCLYCLVSLSVDAFGLEKVFSLHKYNKLLLLNQCSKSVFFTNMEC